MQRGNRPSLDTSNEDAIGIILMLFNKVAWSLLGGDSNKGYAFVSGLEPHNLRLFRLAILLMTTRTTVTMLSFSLLFLFRCLATRSQKP